MSALEIESYDEDAISPDVLDEVEDLIEKERPAHQMLGFPRLVQNPPAGQQQGKTLLLALDSDEQQGWEFVDGGMLYVHADAASWRNGKLDGLRYELQCF